MAYVPIREPGGSDFLLWRDSVTGAPVMSVRRMRGAGDYEDHYRLSDDEVDRFLIDPAAFARFADLAERRQLEERLVRPGRSFGPRAPRLRDRYVSKAPAYSIGRDEDSGQALFSIPVANATTDYLEHYRISEDELKLLLGHPEMAAAFAKCCGRRELDDRLVLEPGPDRGVY